MTFALVSIRSHSGDHVTPCFPSAFRSEGNLEGVVVQRNVIGWRWLCRGARWRLCVRLHRATLWACLCLRLVLGADEACGGLWRNHARGQRGDSGDEGHELALLSLIGFLREEQ